MATYIGTTADDTQLTGYDYLYGIDGNDTLSSDKAGLDVIEGGRGNDYLFIQSSSNGYGDLYGGDDNDTVFGGTLNDHLYGGEGNDLLLGGLPASFPANGSPPPQGVSGDDYLDGGNGVDGLYGYDGNDSLFGGDGNDTNVVISTGKASFLGGGSITSLGGLYGGDGADYLDGGRGNDYLDGGTGIDEMHGGQGNDTYIVDSSSDKVVEAPGEGTDFVYTTAHYVMTDNVEWLIMQDAGGAINAIGTSGNDSIIGNASANGIDAGAGDDVISGGGGSDTLFGRAGTDSLDGGTGDDVMVGGTGDDYYRIDSSTDTVTENPGEGNDWIYANNHFVMSANVENLIQEGNANINAIGNALNNPMAGNAGNNGLDGGAGADILGGFGGNDTFVFHRGEANGDTVLDFTGNGAAPGDSLLFVGYGAGAVFGMIDATHGVVYSGDGLTTEVITFSNAPAIHPSDVLFM